MGRRSCEKHTNIQAPGLCAICLMEEVEELRALRDEIERQANEDSDWQAIWPAINDLYQEYYRAGGDVTTNRMFIESALGRLMSAWDRMLG